MGMRGSGGTSTRFLAQPATAPQKWGAAVVDQCPCARPEMDGPRVVTRTLTPAVGDESCLLTIRGTNLLTNTTRLCTCPFSYRVVRYSKLQSFN